MSLIDKILNYIRSARHGVRPQRLAIPGVELRSAFQLELLEEFEGHYPNLAFERSWNSKSRFFRPNGSFPYQDAFALYGMIVHWKPRRLIAVSCGMAGCAI